MLNHYRIPFLLAGTTLFFLPIFDLPYEIPKILLFRIILSIFVLGWLIEIIIRREITFPDLPKKILLILIALVAVNIISLFLSIDIERSFWGSYYRHQGVFSFLHYGALFLFVLSVFRKKDWAFFEIVLGVLAMLLFGISLWEFFIQKPAFFYGRPIATIGNPDSLGQLLAFINPLLLTTLLLRKTKILFVFFFACSILTLFLSGSRASLLGIIVGLSFYLLMAARKWHKRFWLWLWGILVSFLLLSIIVLNIFSAVPWIQENAVTRRLTFLQYDSIQPIKTRFDIWIGTLSLIRDNFFFGVGQDTFDKAFPPYAPLALRQYPEQYADRAHNLLLDIFASFGFLGFLVYSFSFLYILLTGLYFIREEKNKRDVLRIIGLLTSFVALILATQFSFFVTLHHIYFWTMLAIFFSLIAKKKKVFRIQLSPFFQYSAVFLITIIFALNILFHMTPLIHKVFR